MTYEEFEERAKTRKISITMADFVKAVVKATNELEESVPMNMGNFLLILSFHTKLARELFGKDEPTEEEISLGYVERSENE